MGKYMSGYWKTRAPDIEAVPTTSNLVVGSFVPIPTLVDW